MEQLDRIEKNGVVFVYNKASNLILNALYN